MPLPDCSLPGPGGRGVSPCGGCVRAQRRRPGRSDGRLPAEEAPRPEVHAAALASPVGTAEERQPHLSQPPPGETLLRS